MATLQTTTSPPAAAPQSDAAEPRVRLLVHEGRQVVLIDASGQREIPINDRRDLYDVAVDGFVRAVHGDGRPAVTGEEGLAAYAVAQAALTSSRTGRVVPLSELDT